MPDVVKTCADMGFYGSHLIAMQGPFSEELNVSMMRSVHAKWMVTKESGNAGGFGEKVSAAKKAGVGLVVIGASGGGWDLAGRWNQISGEKFFTRSLRWA